MNIDNIISAILKEWAIVNEELLYFKSAAVLPWSRFQIPERMQMLLDLTEAIPSHVIQIDAGEYDHVYIVDSSMNKLFLTNNETELNVGSFARSKDVVVGGRDNNKLQIKY